MTETTLPPRKGATRPADAERLPLAALLALAMTGFICIVTETLPAGLLPQIGEGLGVSQSFAGQMVTAYALGSLLAAIPLTIATRGWRRRNVLLLTIVGFLVFNSVTALSANYWLTLVSRFFAGTAAGLAWSLLAGYARRMVEPHQQGRAMAIAMVGTPVALSLGVPLGTWLGAVAGWRTAFGIMSLLTLALIVWVQAKVPDYPGQSGREPMPLRRVFTTPGVRPVLGVVVAWMLAHNILYTYVAPFVASAGLAARVDKVLLVFGLAATLLQTALADTAGDGADVALSMNVVAWNGAIAGGGLLGGVLLETQGVASLPWAVLALLSAGWLVAWSARSRGFPAGHRSSNMAVAGH
ncbi:MFS transporter [Acidovorax sacchari]|uniref:MFS transporter n=1 Tax=Acidovorax sacchari TaxID=3230736 RepID=UPI0039E26BBC